MEIICQEEKMEDCEMEVWIAFTTASLAMMVFVITGKLVGSCLCHNVRTAISSKLEAELREDEDKEVTVAKQRRFNEKACIRCTKTFSFLFNKKIVCCDCAFNVCRNCCTWDPHHKVWICTVCQKERAFKSSEWFYENLRHRFNHFGAAKVLKSLCVRKREYDGFRQLVDPTTARIRDHIEKLVEAIVGHSLDNVNINKIYKHKEYERMFVNYHGALSEALAQLAYALQMAINNRPLGDHETPTSAHTTLKLLISNILQESMGLPSLQVAENGIHPGIANDSNGEEDFNSQTYEDILATAILNKVIESYQKPGMNGEATNLVDSNSNPVQLGNRMLNGHIDMGVQTDTETETEVEERLYGKKHVGTMEVGVQSEVEDNFQDQARNAEVGSDDDLSSVETASAGEDFTWTRGSGPQREPVEFMIEEQIEEITTTYETDSENGEKKQKLNVQQKTVPEPAIEKSVVSQEAAESNLEYLLSGLDFIQSRKVPFPELGLDIVEGELPESDSETEENTSPSTRGTPIDSWEENWLFRKRRVAHGNQEPQDPVPMLVPNPMEDFRAKIGDQDADELSDLSEWNSMASLEFSTSDGEPESLVLESSKKEEESALASYELRKLTGENNASEFAQQDLEYTEDYAAVVDRLRKESPIPEPEVEKPIPKPRTSLMNTHKQNLLPRPQYLPIDKRKKSGDLNFQIPPENLCLHAGKAAHFFCKVHGTRPLDVAWFCGSKYLEEGEHYQICRSRDTYSLHIYDTEVKDSGNYTCVAYNTTGKCWHDFQLKVRTSSRAENVPGFILEPEDTKVEEGNSVVISCRVGGYPEPLVLFYKEGLRLQSNENIIIENHGYGEWVLKLRRTMLKDQGEYVIVARNKLGNITSSAMVTVGPKGHQQVCSLTQRTSHFQEDMYDQAENILSTANQKSAAGAVRETTGNALDIITSAEEVLEELNELGDRNDPQSEKDSPPRPGTIAEREHRKWENAIPLPNNPYSKENIAKRMKKCASSPVTSKPTPLEFQEFDGGQDLYVPQSPRKIDCGLKSIDSNRYRRDYYVHNNSESSSPRRWDTGGNTTPREPPVNSSLDMVEEQVYLTTGRVSQLDHKVALLESQVAEVNSTTPEKRVDMLEDRVAQAVAQVTRSNKQVSKVEAEVARRQKEIDHTQQQWLSSQERVRNRVGSLERLSIIPETNDKKSSQPNRFISCITINSMSSPSGTELQKDVEIVERDQLGEMDANIEKKTVMKLNSSPTPQTEGRLNVDSAQNVSETLLNKGDSGPSTSDTEKHMDSDMPSLPSVKELASRFSATETESPSPPLKRSNKDKSDQQTAQGKNVIIVEKNQPESRRVATELPKNLNKPVREVGLEKTGTLDPVDLKVDFVTPVSDKTTVLNNSLHEEWNDQKLVMDNLNMHDMKTPFTMVMAHNITSGCDTPVSTTLPEKDPNSDSVQSYLTGSSLPRPLIDSDNVVDDGTAAPDSNISEYGPQLDVNKVYGLVQNSRIPLTRSPPTAGTFTSDKNKDDVLCNVADESRGIHRMEDVRKETVLRESIPEACRENTQLNSDRMKKEDLQGVEQSKENLRREKRSAKAQKQRKSSSLAEEKTTSGDQDDIVKRKVKKCSVQEMESVATSEKSVQEQVKEQRKNETKENKENQYKEQCKNEETKENAENQYKEQEKIEDKDILPQKHTDKSRNVFSEFHPDKLSVKELRNRFMNPDNVKSGPASKTRASAQDRTSPTLVITGDTDDQKQNSAKSEVHPKSVKQPLLLKYNELKPVQEEPSAEELYSLSKKLQEEDASIGNFQRVHSLTARTVSREFREGLRKSMPRFANRNFMLEQKNSVEEASHLPITDASLTPKTVINGHGTNCVSEKENVCERDTPSPEHLGIPSGPARIPPRQPAHEEFPGYTSDESTASLPRPQRHPPRRRPNRSIAARAAFWDKRVEMGRMSDQSMTEEFPPMFDE